jgi:hypothetical protein
MPLDFTWAGIGIPVVHGKVASMLAKRAASQPPHHQLSGYSAAP